MYQPNECAQQYLPDAKHHIESQNLAKRNYDQIELLWSVALNEKPRDADIEFEEENQDGRLPRDHRASAEADPFRMIVIFTHLNIYFLDNLRRKGY